MPATAGIKRGDSASAWSSARGRSMVAWMALIAVYLFWGSTYLAIRVGDETFPPLLLAGFRYLTAATVLCPFVRGAASAAKRHDRLRHWRSAAIVGMLMLLGGNGLLSVGEVTLPAGIAALVVATVPLWLVVLDALFVVRRAPPPVTILGLILGFVGVAILVRPGPVQHLDLTGFGIVLVAAALWAAGSLYSKHSPHPASPFLGSAQQMLVGGCACLLAGLLTGEAGALRPTWSAAAAIAWLAVPGSVIGLTSYVYTLKELPISTVGTYAFVNPIVAIVLSTLLLHESFTAQTMIATIVILLAVAFILRPWRI